MSELIDLKGKRFGNWVVLEYCGKDKYSKLHWRCKCDCGKIKLVRGDMLRTGKSKSCGCLGLEDKIKRINKARSNFIKFNGGMYNQTQIAKMIGSNPTTLGRYINLYGEQEGISMLALKLEEKRNK